MSKDKESELEVIRRNTLSNYTPLHPELFVLTAETVFAYPLLEAVRDGSSAALMKILTKESPSGIYSFKVFRPEFCAKLLEEIEHFIATSTITKPNSMNNYGNSLLFGFEIKNCIRSNIGRFWI
jgi:hypothetical protein